MTYLVELEQSLSALKSARSALDNAIEQVGSLRTTFTVSRGGSPVTMESVARHVRQANYWACEAESKLSAAQSAQPPEMKVTGTAEADERPALELASAGYRALGEAAAEDATLVAMPRRIWSIPGGLDGDGPEAA
jgi:hypothetical protein